MRESSPGYWKVRLNLPSRLSLNIAANLASNLVTAMVFIVSVPLILPYIGVEAYGLVGFYVSLQALMSVLDLGLNVTITREFAIGSQDQSRAQEIWDLLRTSEVFYWGLAVVIIVAWIGGTHFLTGFLNPQGLSEKTIEQSLVLMGISLALQFPTSLYSNGLFGVQKQALVSGIKTSFSATRNLGVIGVLHFVSPTPEAFFIWHAICNSLIVPIFAIALRRSLPVRPGPAKIRPELITSKWRFVTGIGMITLTATLLANVDRLVVARMLSLEIFGFYTLASTIANGIQWLVQPIFAALFPRLSQLADRSNRSLLIRTYHQGCQLMALAVLPAGVTIALFSKEVVWVWQQNEDTVRNTYLLVSILIGATTINALGFVPYALQLAFASTRLQVIAIAIGLIVTIPGAIVLVSLWGPTGAALVWLVLNFGMIATVVPISHSLLIPGETRFWAIHDVILPAASAFLVAGAARLLFQASDSRVLLTLQLAAAYGSAVAGCLAGSSLLRSWLMRRFRQTNEGSERNAVTIHDDLPPDRSRPQKEPGEVFELLFVATAGSMKGILPTIFACEELRKRRVRFRLTCVGEGEGYGYAKDAVGRLALGRVVTFTGQLSEPDIIRELLKADIFVFPTSHPEELPNTLFRAVATGSPIVMTQIGDYLSEPTNCLFCTMEPANIADRVQELIADKTLRERMVEANLAFDEP